MKIIIKTKKTDILIVLFADLQANFQTYLKISEDMQVLLNSYAELRINYIISNLSYRKLNICLNWSQASVLLTWHAQGN